MRIAYLTNCSVFLPETPTGLILRGPCSNTLPFACWADEIHPPVCFFPSRTISYTTETIISNVCFVHICLYLHIGICSSFYVWVYESTYMAKITYVCCKMWANLQNVICCNQELVKIIFKSNISAVSYSHYYDFIIS